MEPAGRKKERFSQMGGQPSKIVGAQLVAHVKEDFSDVACFQKVDFQGFRAESGGKAIDKRALFVEDFI